MPVSGQNVAEFVTFDSSSSFCQLSTPHKKGGLTEGYEYCLLDEAKPFRSLRQIEVAPAASQATRNRVLSHEACNPEGHAS